MKIRHIVSEHGKQSVVKSEMVTFMKFVSNVCIVLWSVHIYI